MWLGMAMHEESWESILRRLGVKFCLLQWNIIGNVIEGIELLIVFIDMDEVALL